MKPLIILVHIFIKNNVIMYYDVDIMNLEKNPRKLI